MYVSSSYILNPSLCFKTSSCPTLTRRCYNLSKQPNGRGKVLSPSLALGHEPVVSNGELDEFSSSSITRVYRVYACKSFLRKKVEVFSCTHNRLSCSKLARAARVSAQNAPEITPCNCVCVSVLCRLSNWKVIVCFPRGPFRTMQIL